MPNAFYYTNPPPRVPFEQIFLYDPLNDVGRYATTVGANGSITVVGDGVELASGAADEQTTKLKRTDTIVPFTMSWSKVRKVRFSFHLEMDDDLLGVAVVGFGDPDGDNFIGVKAEAGELKGVCQNSAGSTEETLEVFGGGALDQEYHVLAHLTPGSGCAFYLSSTLEDTVTGNLPTGSAQDNDTLYASVVAGYDDPTYYEVKVTLGYLEFTQVK